VKDAVSAGDILREGWPADPARHVNLYMGSGRMGACFDAWGLMHNGLAGSERSSISNTTLMHADHWHRGAHGMDYWLPVARLIWAEGEPEPPTEWRQGLSLWDAVLETSYALAGGAGGAGGRVSMKARFHPGRPDVLFVEIAHDGEIPALLLLPEVDVRTHYDQRVTGAWETSDISADGGRWLGRVSAGTAGSSLALRVVSAEGAAALEATGRGVEIRARGPRGRHLVAVGVAGAARTKELRREMESLPGADELAAEAAGAWHERLGDGFVHIPAAEYQAMWARSVFYVLSSCAPEVRAPAAPMGWSGNGWPFHFPQDVSYIHPALLRLGHLDIARSWVEFYRDRLGEMIDFTRRVWGHEGARGAMWAWEFPIGPGTEIYAGGEAPNVYQYEIHNAAYPVRMAREAARYLRDDAWARDVAWPVVLESARFYGSVLERGSDGTWGIHVKPSMGQDEAGGPDARNYLCALFSARYALQSALTMGRELGIEDGDFDVWGRMLDDGLAVGRLYDRGKGLCATCEGELGRSQIGRQKHPVQLNPLTFLPLGRPADHVERAYEKRHELCVGVSEREYLGWTLAAQWLAASHMGDAAGLLHELAESVPARYVDPDWIQIYETSGAYGAPFYVTSHGLYLQALNDAVVSDYWGDVRIGAAVPDEWDGLRFGRLRTADGHMLSGSRSGGEWDVRMELADGGG